MARARNSTAAAPSGAARLFFQPTQFTPAPALPPLPPSSFPPSYATGAPRPQQQPQQPPHYSANIPPLLSLTPDLLALISSFLEGGFALRTLPLVAAPLADNVDVLIAQVSQPASKPASQSHSVWAVHLLKGDPKQSNE
jgi:hypothetical protein